MNFSDVTEWNIPEGSVEEVRDSSGRIIWQGMISAIYHENIDLVNVHFDSNGGIPESYDREVIMYDKLGELPKPEKQYYTISCWIDNTGNEVTQDTIVTNDLTCTCQWEKSYIEYEKVGNVQLDENKIASNFGSYDYLKTLDDINSSDSTTIVIKCQTGSDITSNQGTFGLMARGANVEFGVYNGKFMWEIVTGSWATQSLGQIDVYPNTIYWQKVEKIGNEINCYISTDGTTWQLDYSGNRNISIQGQFYIGGEVDVQNEYWRGRIYMDESYIETNGKRFYFKLKEESNES